MGYDIGASLAGSSSAGASLNSPFSVVGGARDATSGGSLWLIVGAGFAVLLLVVWLVKK